MVSSKCITVILWILISVNVLTIIIGGLVTWLGYAIPIRLKQFGLAPEIAIGGGFAALLVACLGLCGLNYSSHYTLNVYGLACTLFVLMLLAGSSTPEVWQPVPSGANKQQQITARQQQQPAQASTGNDASVKNNAPTTISMANATTIASQQFTRALRLIDVIQFSLTALLLCLLTAAFVLAYHLRQTNADDCDTGEPIACKSVRQRPSRRRPRRRAAQLRAGSPRHELDQTRSSDQLAILAPEMLMHKRCTCPVASGQQSAAWSGPNGKLIAPFPATDPNQTAQAQPMLHQLAQIKHFSALAPSPEPQMMANDDGQIAMIDQSIEQLIDSGDPSRAPPPLVPCAIYHRSNDSQTDGFGCDCRLCQLLDRAPNAAWAEQMVQDAAPEAEVSSRHKLNSSTDVDNLGGGGAGDDDDNSLDNDNDSLSRPSRSPASGQFSANADDDDLANEQPALFGVISCSTGQVSPAVSRRLSSVDSVVRMMNLNNGSNSRSQIQNQSASADSNRLRRPPICCSSADVTWLQTPLAQYRGASRHRKQRRSRQQSGGNDMTLPAHWRQATADTLTDQRSQQTDREISCTCGRRLERQLRTRGNFKQHVQSCQADDLHGSANSLQMVTETLGESRTQLLDSLSQPMLASVVVDHYHTGASRQPQWRQCGPEPEVDRKHDDDELPVADDNDEALSVHHNHNYLRPQHCCERLHYKCRKHRQQSCRQLCCHNNNNGQTSDRKHWQSVNYCTETNADNQTTGGRQFTSTYAIVKNKKAGRDMDKAGSEATAALVVASTAALLSANHVEVANDHHHQQLELMEGVDLQLHDFDAMPDFGASSSIIQYD